LQSKRDVQQSMSSAMIELLILTALQHQGLDGATAAATVQQQGCCMSCLGQQVVCCIDAIAPLLTCAESPAIWALSVSPRPWSC
jgi:hypothetical protein